MKIQKDLYTKLKADPFVEKTIDTDEKSILDKPNSFFGVIDAIIKNKKNSASSSGGGTDPPK